MGRYLTCSAFDYCIKTISVLRGVRRVNATTAV